MRRIGENKAITLIALVITIIVLLILAGVTIGFAMNGTGLFEKAKLATDEYNNKVHKDNYEIDKMTNEISSQISGNRDIDESKIRQIVEQVLEERNAPRKDLLYTAGDGAVNTKNQLITLSHPVDDYDYIQVVAGGMTYARHKHHSEIFNIEEILYNPGYEFEITGYDTRYINFTFPAEKNILKINNSNELGVTRVYGIKLYS